MSTDGSTEQIDASDPAGEEESLTALESAESPVAKSYPSWHNLIAGGFAGAGSRVATAPLDLIRIRRQLAPAVIYPSESLWETWVKIVQNEGGITALFRGNLAAICVSIQHTSQWNFFN